MKKSSRLLHYVIDPSTLTVNAFCTMEKIAKQSGAKLSSIINLVDTEERIRPPEVCDDVSFANQTCYELSQTFYKHFRTSNGQCNNLQNPLYGSKKCRLSRLLPADNTRLQKPTFFEKPLTHGKLK